jgi:putative Mg2+ transporter-C (MgtC) family protein
VAASVVASDLPTLAGFLRLGVLFKLLLATVLGGAIGLERELAGKPAGLRTNILICIGAVLFMLLSIDVAEIGFSADGHPYGDTTRIAAQIVSGIGFLGAGAILHSEGAVVGLTSAATVWVVAAIGAAIGAGSYVVAIGSTALIVLVLVGLRPVEARLLSKRRRVHATIRVKPGLSYGVIETLIAEQGAHIATSRIFEHDSDCTFELELIGATALFQSIAGKLRALQGVLSVNID